MQIRLRLKILLVLSILVASVYADSPREQFNQMVDQLRRTPTDHTLRKRVIKAALDLKPAPEIPEEARRHFVRATTMQKEAQSNPQLQSAIAEYQQTLNMAPWWPEAYFNEAVALEQIGLLNDALGALTLAKLAAGNRDLTRDVQDRIYAIEAKRDLAAQNSAEAAAVAKRKAEEQVAAPPVFGGLWRRLSDVGTAWENMRFTFDLVGDKVYARTHPGPGMCVDTIWSARISGRVLEGGTSPLVCASGIEKVHSLVSATINATNDRLEGVFHDSQFTAEGERVRRTDPEFGAMIERDRRRREGETFVFVRVP